MAAMSLPVHTSLGELNPVLYVCSHGKEMRRGGRGEAVSRQYVIRPCVACVVVNPASASIFMAF